MKQELTITVNAELSVSDETAETCLALLRIYCRNKRGGDEITPNYEACRWCTFYNPKNYFCDYHNFPVDISQGNQRGNE